MEDPRGYAQIAEELLTDLTPFGGTFHFISFSECNQRLNISKENFRTVFIDPSEGFESFVGDCCDYVAGVRSGDIVLIDCLTSLMGFWGSDWLIGYTYQIILAASGEKKLTTFTAMQRKCHRQFTVKKITETASVVVRVMHDNMSRYCLVPRKAKDRASASMYKPYIMELRKGVRPALGTLDASEIQNPPDRRSDMQYFNCLDSLFLGDDTEDNGEAVKKLCRVLMGMDERIQELAAKFLTLEEMKILRKRTIGSGFIGGKAAGMIIARKIVRQMLPLSRQHFTEYDDSFFLGSDAFYTFMIYNGLWPDYKEYAEDPDSITSRRLHRLVMNGKMPPEILERLEDLIDYYGHFPIIVRSSSLLEDSFESSFAGQYESRFCILTGDDRNMLSQLSEVVKSIYASLFNQEAVSYRKVSKLIGRADVMSVIIQRVSGVYQGNFFFPHVAGVGHSYNSYIWDKKIEPESGLLRLVVGLGTRAVSRGNSDYARMVAINRPNEQPMPGIENKRLYTQKFLDVIDTVTNSRVEIQLSALSTDDFVPSMDIIADRDMEMEKLIFKTTKEYQPVWMVDYEHVINRTTFIKTMSEILKVLEAQYGSPVEIEFTVNFLDKHKYLVNLLQCRPVSVQKVRSDDGEGSSTAEYKVFQAKGSFLGGSSSMMLDTVVYVNWDEYVKLPPEKKKTCADFIGVLNSRIKERDFNSLLLGYGRWGSSVTALGVPVTFTQIDGMQAVIEIGKIEKGLVPELSYGTHFFHDVVESKMTYICVLEDAENFFLDETITKAQNMLRKAIEEPEGLEKVIGYFRFPKRPLRLVTDIRTKTVYIYREIQS